MVFIFGPTTHWTHWSNIIEKLRLYTHLGVTSLYLCSLSFLCKELFLHQFAGVCIHKKENVKESPHYLVIHRSKLIHWSHMTSTRLEFKLSLLSFSVSPHVVCCQNWRMKRSLCILMDFFVQYCHNICSPTFCKIIYVMEFWTQVGRFPRQKGYFVSYVHNAIQI